MTCCRLCAWLSLLLLLGGCTTVKPPAQPTRTPLPRPIVIIGGIVDPGITATHVARYIKRQTGEQRILAVHPGWLWSFDDTADLVVSAVERHFPSDDPDETVEVDVIGISMGGLVARHASAPDNGARKRLNTQRLFTFAAPHSGARLANIFGFFGTPLAMRFNSPFLKRLAQREQRTDDDDYPIIAYTRGRDLTIGAGAAIPAHLEGELIHFPVPWYSAVHLWVYRDGRLLKDMLWRLKAQETAE